MPVIYHDVHYRHFEVSEEKIDLNENTLESLCRSALGTPDQKGVSLWQRAEDRMFGSSDTAGVKLMLNNVADLTDAVFGQMLLVHEKGLQAFLQDKKVTKKLSDVTTAEVYEHIESTPPKGSQFIRGLAYWIVLGNHMFVVKTQTMTMNNVREYIDWLLSSCTTALPANSGLRLQAEMDRSKTGGDIGEVRKLRVTGKSVPINVEVAGEEPMKKTVGTRRVLRQKSMDREEAIPFAQAILGQTGTKSLVESLGPEEYLSVEAALAVRGKRTSESRKKLKELANDLADQSDAKVEIVGKDGRVVNGDAILRTKMPFQVADDASNILDFYDVADKLQEVYHRFVKDGLIEA